MWFVGGGPFAWTIHGINIMEGMAALVTMVFGGFQGLF